MKKLVLPLSFLSWIANSFDSTSIVCSLIPETTEFGENLSYLWGKVAMQNVDRYSFLILSPILIIIEMATLKFYYDNPKIIGKIGVVFCIILAFEILLNFHFLVSAVYYTIKIDSILMPSSFPTFCSVNSIVAAFFQTMHLIFLLIVPLYIVYILRSSLKRGKLSTIQDFKIWNFIYVGLFIIAAVATYVMWYEGVLGLNIFGFCGITFIRAPNINIGIPIAIISCTVVFLLAGVFAIKYFQKHMPNSIGLRKRKRYEQQNIVFYVVGYSVFGIAQSVIMLVLYLNCNQTNPKPELLPLITIFNYIHFIQCCYIFFIIFKQKNVRIAFKKFLKKKFSNKNQSQIEKKDSISQQSPSSPRNEEIFNFEQVLLQIQQQNNNIDILKISQVLTIVSGIYIAYKQYYNIKQEYFNPFICKIDPSEAVLSNFHRKNVSFNKNTKKIYYHQKMSVKINIQIVKDFIQDQNILPKIGILQCTMIIHCPKIFQHLLQNDNLESIFQSFELQQNANKMFNLAEGQGGKSGQFFFYSADNKFVLKTITPDEFAFLNSNLLYFHQHFNRNPDSIMAKIYGLFTFKGNQIQRTYHLILMKNMLGCSNNQILRTYDLKGSRYDRQVNVKRIQANQLQKLTLKDIDFMKQQGRIQASEENKAKLQEIIIKDTLFLKSLNLIDYSLLVVKVCWPNPPKNEDFWGRYQRIPSCVNQNEYYHIGIIDYLQQWDLQKKGEQWWKILIGKKDISAQEPKLYQHRFATFIGEITKEFGQHNQIHRQGDCLPERTELPSLNRNKLYQNMLKLKKLERQGQYLNEKIKHLTENSSQVTEKESQDANAERVEIQMSFSNRAHSYRIPQNLYVSPKNQQITDNNRQYGLQRPYAQSSISESRVTVKKEQSNDLSYPQQPKS